MRLICILQICSAGREIVFFFINKTRAYLFLRTSAEHTPTISFMFFSLQGFAGKPRSLSNWTNLQSVQGHMKEYINGYLSAPAPIGTKTSGGQDHNIPIF